MSRVACWLLAVITVAGAVRPAAAEVVPAPRDQIGVYHWGPTAAAWPGTPDKLTWGADAVAALGSRTIRVALSTRDDYKVNNSKSALSAIAGQPAYAKLFTDSRFSTYLLTVYSADDLTGNWSDGYSKAEQDAGRAEMAQLGTYLLKTYQNKKFIILNWEGDNALSAFPSSDATAWDGYVKWATARVHGVRDARAAVPAATSRISSGLEFNAIKRLDSGAACDTTTNKCVISYVAPRVDADYYSYSSWQSLDSDGSRLTRDLTVAYDLVSATRPAVTHANFLVGEFGAARDINGECKAAAQVRATVAALEAWGASYGIFWQAFDNDPASGIYDGFGAYRRDRSLSLSGQTLENLYATGTPTVPAATCAAINAGGVVNGKTFKPVIHPGDVISIFGSGFSASGNIVWIKQGAKSYQIKAGSPWWHESAGQINATLPAGVVTGRNVNVYVTRSDARVSNGQLIDITPS
ncbi:hypothetical protein [Nonomuraea fuscirosea]|uniref:hypothetical protein n=1 Tax=Nonomuraea fuscirosea TaxID=1291556 RepID=UPI0011B24166|nr:hypothetical protein [Nonomuraea fuscirosea]